MHQQQPRVALWSPLLLRPAMTLSLLYSEASMTLSLLYTLCALRISQKFGIFRSSGYSHQRLHHLLLPTSRSKELWTWGQHLCTRKRLRGEPGRRDGNLVTTIFLFLHSVLASSCCMQEGIMDNSKLKLLLIETILKWIQVIIRLMLILMIRIIIIYHVLVMVIQPRGFFHVS